MSLPIESVEIKNFRSFDHLRVDGFKRITVIGGMNNVGKTNLLEALFLFHGPASTHLPVTLNVNRGLLMKYFAAKDAWDWLFHDRNSDEDAEISVVGQEGQRGTLSISIRHEISNEASDLQPNSPVTVTPLIADQLIFTYRVGGKEFISTAGPAEPRAANIPSVLPAMGFPSTLRYMAESYQFYTALKQAGRTKELLAAIRLFAPDCEDIEFLDWCGTPTPHVFREHPSPPIPIQLYGDGAARIFALILALDHCRGGALFVDELENGFHHSMLGQLWQILNRLTLDNNVQLVVSTHSLELLFAASRDLPSSSTDAFNYIRLQRIEGQIKAFEYAPSLIKAAEDADAEVR